MLDTYPSYSDKSIMAMWMRQHIFYFIRWIVCFSPCAAWSRSFMVIKSFPVSDSHLSNILASHDLEQGSYQIYLSLSNFQGLVLSWHMKHALLICAGSLLGSWCVVHGYVLRKSMDRLKTTTGHCWRLALCISNQIELLVWEYKCEDGGRILIGVVSSRSWYSFAYSILTFTDHINWRGVYLSTVASITRDPQMYELSLCLFWVLSSYLWY